MDMQTTKIKECEVCEIRVNKDHWARHLKSKNHLTKWAESEGLHDFQSKSHLELVNIQKLYKSRNTIDYSAYNNHKLNELAQEKGLEVTHEMSRDKLIKRLFNIGDYATTKLHIFNISKIQQLAKVHELKSIYNRNKDELIGEIYKKKGLFYCEPCKLAAKDRHLHEATEKHCLKTGAGFADVSEYSKTGRFKTVIYNNTTPKEDGLVLDIHKFLEPLAPKVIEMIRKIDRNIKLYMSLECQYVRDRIDQGKQLTIMTFHTKTVTVYRANNLVEEVDTKFKELVDKEGKNQPPQGSGWSLNRVVRLIVKTAEFNPLSASSYIDLPKWVKDKHACINIQNKDEKCFIYSVLCALNEPSINPYKPYHYKKHVNDEIFQGFDYPMTINNIQKFEKKSFNHISSYPSMAINVFEIGQIKKTSKKRGDIRPLHISDFEETAEKIVNLLLIATDLKQHYVYIKDLSRLIASQISKHKRHLQFCTSCLSHFYSQSRLDQHKAYCKDHKPCVMAMPKPGTTIKFENFNKKFQHPYIIYADFETLNINQAQEEGNTTTTTKVKKHVPYGFAIYLVSRVNGEKFKPFVYRARTEDDLKGVPKTFVKCLHKLLIIIGKKYKNSKPLELTAAEEIIFQMSTVCHICEVPFTEDDVKVRDHCHLTKESSFLGAAHGTCNLKRCLVTKIPVVLHNLSNFDSHLFIEKLFHYNKGSRMTVIANSEENYITFEKNMFKVADDPSSKYFKLSFIDSFRFLNSSLEKLANNLERGQMHHLNRFVNKHSKSYLNMTQERSFQILRAKGIFPYDYVDSLEKLNCDTLLHRDVFHDSLNNKDISTPDYLIYKLVWTNLREGKQKLGYYSDLYNIQDVLLLADIFENFRDVCLENYQLDPAYYLTAPSLAWDAMLKMTKSKIGLISDPDMHLMVERGIRGGIAQVCKRHVTTNNQYIEGYDQSKPKNFLMYLDACNLYGWALSQPLPYQSFTWVNPQAFTIDEWVHAAEVLDCENDQKGYILEVDLEYPQYLHDSHRDVPFAAEHYNSKLCTTLQDKHKYITHIRNLQQMLRHGLILRKVHRVISFDQKPFIKKYVDFNSEKRKIAQNEFEKNFYKLMVNSVFGRTMMNLRKRQNIELCNEARASKISKKPSFSRFTMFNKNFFACHTLKNKLNMNQPIQVGCAVLEISKSLMYKFFYDKLKVWDPSVNLVLMDTDSYLVEMGQDPYDIIGSHLDDFDTSNYPSDHPLYSIVNKNVPGKMKDELGGFPMTEVCGLRAKLYTYLYYDKTMKKEKCEIRCKGIKKSIAKKTIKMEHFKSALFENQKIHRQVTNIRSTKHVLFTENQQKLALSSNDDKRFILENKVDTLPWGHCELPSSSKGETMEVD